MKAKGLLLILTILVISCDNLQVSLEKKMAVQTGEPNNEMIYATSAEVSAQIIDEGKGYNEYGFCYSKNTPTPRLSNQKAYKKGNSGNIFSMSLNNLKPQTHYYARAYLWNNGKVAYGNVISFSTKAPPAEFMVYTGQVSENNGRLEVGGSVDMISGKVMQFGHIWKTGDSDNLSFDNWDGRQVFNVEITSDRMFTSSINEPVSGVSYFIRSFATDGINYEYGAIRQYNYY